jgi:signal transduction histidine kinase
MEVTSSRAICIHLFDAERLTLRLVGQQNLREDTQTSLMAVQPEAGFRRWLQQPNAPLVTTNLAQMTILPGALRSADFATYLGAQIKIGNRVEGLLSCYRFTDRGFGVDEIALVTALAELVGMMLETQRLRRNAEEMAVVEERQRLARDLHDSVTQTLYSLSLFSRAGREAAEDGDTDRLNHSLNELERNTLHALREMRLLLYELRPADLEQEGLARAIELRLNTVERRVGLQLDVFLGELPPMPSSHEVELYHIIVEALNNVVKHAAASRLSLLLAPAGGQLHLRIADNGHGFDPLQVTGGLGLRNIRERVAQLHGQLTIESSPGYGTRLEAFFPNPI